jgi:membrane associated rhomboid family serine protease
MVIPIHDRNPARRTPYVTYALIAVNVLVFLTGPVIGTTMHTPSYGQACAVQKYYLMHGAIPKELLSNHVLRGAAIPAMQVSTSQGTKFCVFSALPSKIPVLSVLEAMFIHTGWVHLLGNMLFLFVFGDNVEDRLGRLHYLLFYVGVGYLSSYTFALLNPHSVSTLVGASGAISGVLGAYAYLYPRAKVISLFFFIPLRFPAWVVLGSWFVLQLPVFQNLLGMGTDSGVAYAAHVSGFVAGFLYVMLVAHREPPRPTLPTGPESPYGSYQPPSAPGFGAGGRSPRAAV